MPLPEGISVTDMRVVYAQKSDSCDPTDLGQDLEIETADAGGGPYLILKTDRWRWILKQRRQCSLPS